MNGNNGDNADNLFLMPNPNSPKRSNLLTEENLEEFIIQSFSYICITTIINIYLWQTLLIPH